MNRLLSEDESYLIGFVQGDGNIYEQTRNRGRVSIEISERDIDILLKLKTIVQRMFGCNAVISKRTRDTNFKSGYKSAKLCVCDILFRKWICQFVPVGKKDTKISAPNNVSEKDYLRGLFDADGSLGVTAKNRCFMSFCTKSDMIKDFLVKSISSNTGVNKAVEKNGRDLIYNICLFDEDAVAYLSFLYGEASIYLERKYKKYLAIMEWKRSVPKITFRRKWWSTEEDKIVTSSKLTIEEKIEILNRTKKSISMRYYRILNGFSY